MFGQAGFDAPPVVEEENAQVGVIPSVEQKEWVTNPTHFNGQGVYNVITRVPFEEIRWWLLAVVGAFMALNI